MFAEMANIINKKPYILPYRRNRDNTPPVEPDPQPVPDQVDPEPQPIDDGNSPIIDTPKEPESNKVRVAILAAIACAIAGAGAGLFFQLRNEIES
jgi:hypothetical protein